MTSFNTSYVSSNNCEEDNKSRDHFWMKSKKNVIGFWKLTQSMQTSITHLL